MPTYSYTMPYYYTTSSTTSNTYDCSGYTTWKTSWTDKEYIKTWIESLKKEKTVTEEEILNLIKDDD